MTFANRNNPYSFDSFLQWRNNVDYYRDDKFIQKVVRHFTSHSWKEIDRSARQISPKVSGRWRDYADTAARPENKPGLLHFDAHNHRIDRIVRPLETLIMEKEVFQEALFSEKTEPWLRLLKMYLIYQNGEACIACPLTCTEGLVALLEAFADTRETLEILKHCREGQAGEYGIGAQYLTEIQGGSDVPANILEAVKEEDCWRLYGTKFFCSATHADYAVVTAKPVGSEKIGVFVVPSWLPGDKIKERRNSHTIDRLKWKMGTSELPTAEITFNGAVAYPLGQLEKGLANIVGIVLTYSRLTVGLSGAASMTRAAREAHQYSEFRKAFGQPIAQFPMAASQIEKLEKNARRSTAGAFKIYKLFLELDGKVKTAIDSKEPLEMQHKRFNVRELVMLQKITTSWDATEQLRTAISLFGGHGVIEDFSALPRLYRDAVVNELWEGPRNVLLQQMHRDLQMAKLWYAPAEFVKNLLSGGDEEAANILAREIDELVAYPSLTETSETTREICSRWDNFCHCLCHAYQDLAMEEVLHENP